MNGEVFLEGQSLLTGGIYVNPGAKLEEKTITENGTYYPSTGKDGFSKVVVNVPQPQPVLASINIEENGTYTPPEGTDGYNNIKVEVPQPQPVLSSISITENGTYTPPEGTDGYNNISVEVPAPTVTLQDKTVTENGSYTADQGYNGLGTVTVNVDIPSNVYKTIGKNMVLINEDGISQNWVNFDKSLTVGKKYIILLYDRNQSASNYPVINSFEWTGTYTTITMYYTTSSNKEYEISQTAIRCRSSNTRQLYTSIIELPDEFAINPFT